MDDALPNDQNVLLPGTPSFGDASWIHKGDKAIGSKRTIDGVKCKGMQVIPTTLHTEYIHYSTYSIRGLYAPSFDPSDAVDKSRVPPALRFAHPSQSRGHVDSSIERGIVSSVRCFCDRDSFLSFLQMR